MWSEFLGIQFNDADLQWLWVQQLLSHARGRITQVHPCALGPNPDPPIHCAPP